MSVSLVRIAGVLGFLGVALGAFGAHGLRARVTPDLLEVWKTGVLYHVLHALALLAVGLGADRLAWPRAVGALFGAGVVIFSGSLYVLTLSGTRWWGAITPLGGVAFLAGWALLAFGGRAG